MLALRSYLNQARLFTCKLYVISLFFSASTWSIWLFIFHYRCIKYLVKLLSIFHILYISLSVTSVNDLLKFQKRLTPCSCNSGHWSQAVTRTSLSHETNNVSATTQASLPKTQENAKTLLPTKTSGVPSSPSTITKLFKSNISKAISAASLPSSHKGDDTSELTGLYHLISFEEVDKSVRQTDHFTTPSITASYHNETHSRHRDLATMLAELAGSSSSSITASASSLNLKASSTITSGASQSVSLRKQGTTDNDKITNCF